MKKFIFIFVFALMAAVGAFAQFGFLDKLQGITNSSPGQDGKISSIKNMFGSAGKVLKGMAGIGLQEELTIGNSVAVQIVAKYGGLVRDEAITRRVNLVGKSLACYCDRPELNFHFGVLNSPTVNAFSTPGGYVFITRGLYDMIQNDDQLAGVLAHEITHVTRKHALKIIERGQFFEGVTGLTSEAGAMAKKADLTRYSQGVGQITTTLFEKGFDPQIEFDADKGGFTLAATVGYASNGLEQCLQTLQQHESPNTTIFPTHPPLDKRIQKLESYQAGGI
jgi:beta-barrel assembly-enhancing protease